MTTLRREPLPAGIVDDLAARRDAMLRDSAWWRRLGDRYVARFDMRAERAYRAAQSLRSGALVAQRRLDAAAGFGRWITPAELRGPR